MAPRTQQPPYNMVSKGAAGMGGALLDYSHSIWLFTVAGALTNGVNGDGAGWAAKGSLALRLDTGNWYRNTGTKLSPIWVELSTP